MVKLSTIIKRSTKKNKRKPKKLIDKNKPKQALSSFMYYNLANRDRIISNHPRIKVTEISVILGKEWRALDDDQKHLWDDYARKDRERYSKEIEKYNTNLKNQSNKGEIQKFNNKDDDNPISQSEDKQNRKLEIKKPLKELKEQNQNNHTITASLDEVKLNLVKKKTVTFNSNTRDLKLKTNGSTSSKNVTKVAKRRLRKNKMQHFVVTDRN
ncbi:unnamed protein product [Cunninghamella blakesleeana]